MEINIRKAIAEDAYDLAFCHISSWQSAYKGIVPDEYLEKMLIEKDQLIERYRNNIKDTGYPEYFCVMYDGKIIGFIIINISFDNEKHNIGEIWAVYLIEEFRNMGYGKEMLKFSIEKLKNLESEEIFLWVFEENIKARKFYEKNNFNYNGEKRENSWYGKPLIQLKYVLNI